MPRAQCLGDVVESVQRRSLGRDEQDLGHRAPPSLAVPWGCDWPPTSAAISRTAGSMTARREYCSACSRAFLRSSSVVVSAIRAVLTNDTTAFSALHSGGGGTHSG